LRGQGGELVKLPEPRFESEVSIEKALLKRRSVRQYTNKPLSLEQVSQLLWAAQGITSPQGFRTTPSAGALYPLEVYLAAGEVTGLPAGIYRYKPQGHALLKIAGEDKRAELGEAALGQSCVKSGAAVIVICAIFERTTGKYGERGLGYVHMEAGAASQNIYLQSVSLGLGTVVVGGFSPAKVKRVMNIKDNEQPLYLMPVGRK